MLLSRLRPRRSAFSSILRTQTRTQIQKFTMSTSSSNPTSTDPTNSNPLRNSNTPTNSNPPTTQANPSSPDLHPESKTTPKTPLALPEAPSTTTTHNQTATTTPLDLSSGSTTVKLNHLGPIVVNADGTMSRISNWEQMAEIERRNTVRIISRRNKERLEVLRGREGEGK